MELDDLARMVRQVAERRKGQKSEGGEEKFRTRVNQLNTKLKVAVKQLILNSQV